MYKVLYVNSFYSLYYYHHYDHCIVDIAILYYMQTWSLYIIKRIYCLFVCLFVCVIADSEYKCNSKLISLFLESFFSRIFFSRESCIWYLWFLFITESFSLESSCKTTSLTTSICSTVRKQVNDT